MAKWIHFRDVGPSESGKTRIWYVANLEHKPDIGTVQWYGPWRKYCFMPHSSMVFEEQCLRDIAEFCESRTREHRAARKPVPA